MTKHILSLASDSRIGAHRRVSAPRERMGRGPLLPVQCGPQTGCADAFAGRFDGPSFAGFSVKVCAP